MFESRVSQLINMRKKDILTQEGERMNELRKLNMLRNSMVCILRHILLQTKSKK
jgi:hypothetical protein